MKKEVLVLFSCIILAFSQVATYRKIVVPDGNALCLDGSPGVYYIDDSGRIPTKFLLHFDGGGWCAEGDLASTIESCYQRSKTDLGSSRNYPATMNIGAGIQSNSAQNSFNNYTKVIFKYCDGSGHQGRRDAPIPYKDTNLFFRGQDIVIAALNHLQQTKGIFSRSQQIMVSGGSAGGVAAFTWSNYIWDRSGNKNVYTVPDAGIFLDYPNYRSGRSQFRVMYENLFKVANANANPPTPECVNAHPGQPWLCMFAQYMYPHLKTKVFPIQSLYDLVGITAVVGADCIQGHSLQSCTPDQRNHIEDYKNNVINFLGQIAGNPANGFWAIACVEHELTTGIFYSHNYEIPMRSGSTADIGLNGWVLKKPIGHVYIDTVAWPGNQPCAN